MRRDNRAYQQSDYSDYGYSQDYPSPNAYIPASRVGYGYSQQFQAQQQGMTDDHRGRVSSVFSLLMSIAVMILSFGGFLLPSILMRGTGTSDIISTVTYIAFGYISILGALLLQSPTILLALRSVSTPQGHVGRGRGLVSVILSCIFPVTCLALLSVFAVGQVQSAMASGILPQVVTGTDGKPQLVMPEGMNSTMGSIMGQVNELAEEGYSVGMDENGNIVATDPNGQQVTITSEDLAQIGL